jgi:hypothetical protein
MTKENLREILSDAREKGQVGLFIWVDWWTWHDLRLETSPGNENYDSSIEALSRQEWYKATRTVFKYAVFLSVPIEKMVSDEKFFGEVLTVCEKFIGPVTLVPLNELSRLCYKGEGLH